ncbi:adenine-specific DNA-methyltransferase [Pelagicoccus sp. SDUM812002]|uniref:adenine-specific DNA-methyltransferase n=1 Tax=Pelagicoccus sp. SDUM812002 TaxID=3041266 RepID=UPI00280D76A9|nr:adenine-specific DNA-methyltransferase [Pelagicoccus sp. SDUM812002]MDQ8188590.1 adenine-specific DNA-methyltransferase [Pelagicoccus sp. SDUM812002]
MEVFEKNGQKIIRGDAIESLNQEVLDESVDLLFVDPPYNIGKNFNGCLDKWASDEDYMSWCKTWLDLCIQKVKPNGSMYFMASTQCMPYFDLYLREQVSILSRIVWSYDSSGVQAKKYYGSLYEPILFCVKNQKDYKFNPDSILVEAKTGAKRKLIDYRGGTPKPYNTKKVPGNVWNFPRVRYRMDEYENHPSQKPESLLERIILASSDEGDLVLDPFSGTFTTSSVAARLNRKSIGIEQDLEYFKAGLRRTGVASHYDGEALTGVAKSTARRNSKKQISPKDQLTLI